MPLSPRVPHAHPRTRRAAWVIRLLSVILTGLASASHAGDFTPEPPAAIETRYLTDRVGVRLTRSAAGALNQSPRPSATAPGLARIAASAGVVAFEPEFPQAPGTTTNSHATIDLSEFMIARLAPGVTPEQAVAKLRRAIEIRDAWPIAILPVTAAPPNDSLWFRSYHLYQASRRDIHALEAWDVYRGDSSVIVAILDTGILPNHPDLGGLDGTTHLWINPLERDGVANADDDANGFEDDFWGWDFVASAPAALASDGEDWRDADNDPNDFASHGTAIAGLVGGFVDNVIGVTGILPDVRMMALRIGWASLDNPTGVIAMSYAAQAVSYATRMGADVINCSFATVSSPDFEAAVDAALRAGVIVVTASGNNGTPHELALRPDVVSVTATDALDKLQRFGNLGNYVDLAAPGTALPTTSVRRAGTDSLGVRQPGYTTGATGTSFSSGIVSGTVALIQGDRRRQNLPPYTPAEILLRLNETSDDIRSVNVGLTGYGAGRLNLQRALSDPPGSRVIPASDSIVGPGASFDTKTPQPKFAYAVRSGELVIREGLGGAQLMRAPLPASPVSGVTMGFMGGGRGYEWFVVTSNGKLIGLDEHGAAFPGWPVDIGATPADMPPVLGDLDADGRLDIVLGSRAGTVRAWNMFGEMLPGFPRMVGTSSNAEVHVALSSLDDSAGVEVIAVSSAGTVDVFRRGGASLPGWPQTAAPEAGRPTVISSNSERAPAIVVPAGESVFGFDPDGTELWRQYVSGFTNGVLTAADFDGDGADEIVVPLRSRPRVELLDFGGGSRAIIDWTTISKLSTTVEPLVGALRTPAALDIAVFVPDVGLLAFNAQGSLLLGYPRPGLAGSNGAFGDFNRDGNLELFAGSGWNGDLYMYSGAPGLATLPAAGWSTARGNAARTGSRFYNPLDSVGTTDTTRQLLISRTSVDFGDVWLGTSGVESFHIVNATTDTLTLDVDAPGNPFEVTPLTFTLAPERVQQVSIRFTPTLRAPASGDVTVRDRAGRNAALAVDVRGAGILPPELVTVVDTLRATVVVGDSIIVPLALENHGDAPLVVRPSLELPNPTLALRAGGPAGRQAVLASSTPVAWLQTLLAQLGFDVIRASVETLRADTLSQADVIVVAIDGGWVGALVVQRLADAARAGAAVILLGGTRYRPFEQALHQQLIANPNSAGWMTSRSPNLIVQLPTSVLADSLPLVHDWNTRETSYYCLKVADVDAQVIAVNGNGDPALVYKRIGLGSVLVWTGTPSDSAWKHPADLAVIRQVVANAVRAASEWVSIRVDPITIPGQSTRQLDVVFTAEAQNAGTLTAHIRFDSNDPARPFQRLPIRLDVTVPGVVPASAMRKSR